MAGEGGWGKAGIQTLCTLAVAGLSLLCTEQFKVEKDPAKNPKLIFMAGPCEEKGPVLWDRERPT